MFDVFIAVLESFDFVIEVVVNLISLFGGNTQKTNKNLN